MIKILVVNQNRRPSKDSRLLKLLSVKEHKCYFLNNSTSLADGIFLNSFDVVIINLTKNSIVNTLPSGNYKVILMVGQNETYLLPYVPSFQGIVQKENIEELRTAIHVVMAGGCYMSREIKEALFSKINTFNKASSSEYSTEVLTKMELRVAEELMADKTNQEIADTLFMSKRTVEYHIASCIQKLNVNSRVGLAIKIAQANYLIGNPHIKEIV
ncbi:helix-turn-helix transcriptional regulator [Oceanobacillus sp. FSL H7-0719]|uniref:helix-turn-helix transcriptional regulator n=1 Tax=Oceanobacillus sp. FSL H7-0719 TaxID=2954507 RepID=UPI00324AA3CF